MGACVGARVHASAAAPFAPRPEETRMHAACLLATGASQDALCCAAPRRPRLSQHASRTQKYRYKRTCSLRAAQPAHATGMPPTGAGGCCTAPPRVGSPPPPARSRFMRRQLLLCGGTRASHWSGNRVSSRAREGDAAERIAAAHMYARVRCLLLEQPRATRAAATLRRPGQGERCPLTRQIPPGRATTRGACLRLFSHNRSRTCMSRGQEFSARA